MTLRIKQIFLIVSCGLVWCGAQASAVQSKILAEAIKVHGEASSREARNKSLGEVILQARKKRSEEEEKLKAAGQQAVSPVSANPSARVEQKQFVITFPAGAAPGHWQQKLNNFSININENGFDPLTTESFEEVASAKQDFLMVVASVSERGPLKLYEADSFVRFLANDTGNPVGAPGRIPLINSQNICCVKYRKERDVQQPSFTYICSWDELLPLLKAEEELAQHKIERERLFQQNGALLGSDFGHLRQRDLRGAVLNDKSRGFAGLVNDPVGLGLGRRAFVKAMFSAVFMAALQGIFNNVTARYYGELVNQSSWSNKQPLRESLSALAAFVWQTKLSEASWTFCPQLFGAITQMIFETMPLPGYPRVWRNQALNMRAYWSIIDIILWSGIDGR